MNYFSEEDLLDCYSSILERTEADIELILVSNSLLQDSFIKDLASLGKPIKTIQNEDNLGFAKACNIGAKHATGDFLFFLNPDTVFLNDSIHHLIKCFEESENPGILGAKTYTPDKKPIASAKNHLSVFYFFSLLLPFLKAMSNKSYGHFLPDNSMEVPVVNGHALFIKSDLYKSIDGMDENLFMYWEENDLCLRIQKLDFSVIYCHSAEIIHKSGTSTRKHFSKMEIEKHRSQKKFILKHYPYWDGLNRITGILAYFWRSVYSLLLFKKSKFKQFWSLFNWYTFSYK
ncbi:glycosyltransferase family 2 protein [Gracilimonas sp.]|uniref:glycosyltransferase family 2 protein n=1 Tax=Gracilimonas sp. TaxID=1974203 RepID=UPI003D097BFD